MKIFKKKIVILLTGIIIGLAGGFLYWKFVGCTSGSCAITSHWYSSVLFGGIFGYLIADMFVPKTKVTTELNKTEE